MESDIISRLRHPKEDGDGIVMLIFGIMSWTFIIAFLLAALVTRPATGAVYVAYAVGFVLFMFISAALFKAKISGHLNLFKIILKGPAHLIPFLGPANSRAREFTCDWVGLTFRTTSNHRAQPCKCSLAAPGA